MSNMDSSSSELTVHDEVSPDFMCSICLDLLYKPVVIACGHMCCFWCIHYSMINYRGSKCPICRQSYMYFASICSLLHNLLMKTNHVDYKRREGEVHEKEKSQNYFSPQDIECLTNESNSSYEGMKEKEVSISDVICFGCKEILFRPSVLNCGHVYCESCMVILMNDKLKCHVCESIHPGDFPKVCLVLDHFLEKHFPQQYFQRKEFFQSTKVRQDQNLGQSSCVSDVESKKTKSESVFPEDISKSHFEVGCDTCGMYPIVGKRYKCKDCREEVGFDMCEVCYDSSSKRQGRFNQRHTPDHVFVLDNSLQLGIILLRSRPSSIPTIQEHEDPLP